MIDRIEDAKVIESIYLENINKPTFLVLYAPTGVGKSYFVDEVFKKFNETSYIRIEITQREAEETKGAYISNFAKNINKYAKRTHEFPTLENFINDIFHKELNRERILVDLLDIAVAMFNETATKKIHSEKVFRDNVIESILQNDGDTPIAILLEYIIYISNVKRLVITIENIQDSNSKFNNFLQELIRKTKNIFFIGEYTIRKIGETPSDYVNQFSVKNIEVYPLNKLKKEDLIGGLKTIVDIDILDDIKEIVSSSYDMSVGNLKSIEWLIKLNRRKWKLSTEKNLSIIKYDNALHSLYSSLNNDQKILLWYVVVHLGNVEVKIFFKFLQSTHNENPYIYNGLEVLIEIGFLTQDDQTFKLQHDSLNELLKEEEDSLKFLLIANSNWLIFYKKITLSSDIQSLLSDKFNKQDILILQLTFIINIGGTSNIDWMNQILFEVNKSLNSDGNYSLVSKLIKTFEQINESNTNKNLMSKTYQWIIIILSKLGYSQEVFSLQQKYNSNKSSNLVHLLECSARIASCDKSVLNSLVKIDESENPFLVIGSKLLLVRYYRTFGQINKAYSIWKKLKNDYKKSPFWGVILEQVNICSYNMSKRLKYSQMAGKEYEKGDNSYHLCSNLLNINAHLFHSYYLGQASKRKFIKVAKENLEKVKKIIPYSHYPLHVYTNQKAIFQLTLGDVPTDVIIQNLKNAYLNCGIPGNKPLIGANIIALGIKQNNVSEIENYVVELLSMSRKFSELKSEFARYPLLNCYKYFALIDDKPHMQEIINLCSKGSLFNNYLDYLFINKYSIKLIFNSTNYYLCNIVNWDIDFEFIENQYQSLTK